MHNKRGQTKISFGMIFSIILIILFLSFGFWGIKKFMTLSDVAKIVQFKDNLQGDIDKLWRGSQGAQNVEYYIPRNVQYICFIDYISGQNGERYSQIYTDMRTTFMEYENMFLYPLSSVEGLVSTQIKHVDLSSTTSAENPFCIENVNGKIKLRIEKDFEDESVTILGQNE